MSALAKSAKKQLKHQLYVAGDQRRHNLSPTQVKTSEFEL